MNYWKTLLTISAKPDGVGGCVSALDRKGRTIWIADAHRDDANRFVVRADEKLTVFLENLHRRSAPARIGLTRGRDFFKLDTLYGSESGGGHFPR